MHKRDLITHKRDLIIHRRDLFIHKKDLCRQKRDLYTPKRYISETQKRPIKWRTQKGGLTENPTETYA